LIVQEYLESTDETEYPLLRITAAGKALCRDEGMVRLGLPVPTTKPLKKAKTAKKPAGEIEAADESLFERLRAVRLALAKKAGLPPYVVCQDYTLLEMAAVKPRTLDDLLEIKGMGEKRVQKYGRYFLDLIAGRSDVPTED
jgi:ATP-dependent DNA helicase RecQ